MNPHAVRADQDNAQLDVSQLHCVARHCGAHLLVDALRKAIDPEKLRLTIPEQFQEFNPKIDSARFVDYEGKLAIEMNLSALIPAAKITDMVKELIDKKV